MYFAAILCVLSALSSTSLAQIDPNTVDIGTRSQWCTAQKQSCPLLCLQFPGNDGSTTMNKCDPDTLVFSCVCAVNGMSPNASQFSQTIPYFECTETNNQCVTNCGSDNACSDACRANHPCGAQDPQRVNTTTATTHPQTATSSSSDGSAATGTNFATLGSGSDASAATGGTGSGGVSGSGAAPAFGGPDGLAASVGRAYGLAIVLGGVFAGFVLVL